jgi:2-methylcitrate dehydratase PrpD
MAQRGAQGPLKIFEGEDGYLKAFADDVKQDVLTRGLGKTFEICNAYVKFYAACRHVHACVDAALEAFGRIPAETSEIKSIIVETYSAAVRLAGITNVTTPSAGRFSIPFSVALALVKKRAGAEEYSEENIRNEDIQSLSRRVSFSVGTKWEQSYPNKRGATVRIVTGNGRESSAEVELAKGEPENPATWEEVYDKFYANATLLLSEKEARMLADVVLNLDDASVEALTTLI